MYTQISQHSGLDKVDVQRIEDWKKRLENTVWVRTVGATCLAMSAAEARWLGEALLAAARVAEAQHGDEQGELFAALHPEGEEQRRATVLARAKDLLEPTGAAVPE